MNINFFPIVCFFSLFEPVISFAMDVDNQSTYELCQEQVSHLWHQSHVEESALQSLEPKESLQSFQLFTWTEEKRENKNEILTYERIYISPKEIKMLPYLNISGRIPCIFDAFNTSLAPQVFTIKVTILSQYLPYNLHVGADYPKTEILGSKVNIYARALYTGSIDTSAHESSFHLVFPKQIRYPIYKKADNPQHIFLHLWENKLPMEGIFTKNSLVTDVNLNTVIGENEIKIDYTMLLELWKKKEKAYLEILIDLGKSLIEIK